MWPNWYHFSHFHFWMQLSWTLCAMFTVLHHTADRMPYALLTELGTHCMKQSQHFSMVPLRGSSLTNLTNMRGFIYVWLSWPYFNDLNSSLCAAKGFALFGLQLGSDISDPQLLKNKAIKVSISARLCCARKCSAQTQITRHRGPCFKIQSSMFTLFLIPLTWSFIVHCPDTPSPVSSLPLDWSCILLQSQQFVILSPATAG